MILFHSTNDFLSFPEGQSTLEFLPIETHLYPFGGHMGLIIEPRVLKELDASLSSIKTTTHHPPK